MPTDTTDLDDFLGKQPPPPTYGEEPPAPATGPLQEVTSTVDENSFLASVGLDPSASGHDPASGRRPAVSVTDPKTMLPALVMAILFVGITFRILGIF